MRKGEMWSGETGGVERGEMMREEELRDGCEEWR